jgi:hypothetical protein
MKKRFTLTITILLLFGFAVGQKNSKAILLKGRVLDNNNNEPIPFAAVVIKGTKIHCTTDSSGYYSIDVTATSDTLKNVTLYSSYVGYMTQEFLIKHKITKTITHDFKLINRPACEMPDPWSAIKINKSDTAKFTKILKRGLDTLTFYRRHSNCDTVTYYKFQVFKQSQTYGIRTFIPIKYAQPKRCKDLFSVDPNKIVFKTSQSCLHSPETINFMNAFEQGIRNIKRDTTNCSNEIQYSMSIGTKKYKSKIKTCNQDIERLMNMYFGCPIIDQDIKQTGY